MNIAILGGGVAGMSSAIALKQKGFNVTIYERNKSELNIGAGIVIWPNASYILEQLNILEEVKKVSAYPTLMERISKDGDSLGSINIKEINNLMSYPSLSILRRDFQSILVSKVNELGISIKYDYIVSEIKDKNGLANVYFKNGENITADIIIGADGRMSSISRKFVVGHNKPVYQGFINWVGVFESDKKIFKDTVIRDYWGIGERFGIVPVSEYKAYWAGGLVSKDIGINEKSEYKKELNSIFSDYPGLINEIITGSKESQINKIYLHDHNPIKVWHKKNLILIGDCAHAPLPTSGQGACQALEDSYHLANCLSAYSNNLDYAFSKFTEIRLDKTSNIINSGRGLAKSIFNTDKEYCRIRNENSKTTDYLKVAKDMAYAWSHNLDINV